VSFPTWAIAIGLIVLTGLLKAMRYIYPIPGDVLYWVSAIHVGAMVIVAIKVLDHLRYVLAPARWWMMRALLGGRESTAAQSVSPAESAAAARPTVGGRA
jgi:hypothetical protein